MTPARPSPHNPYVYTPSKQLPALIEMWGWQQADYLAHPEQFGDTAASGLVHATAHLDWLHEIIAWREHLRRQNATLPRVETVDIRWRFSRAKDRLSVREYVERFTASEPRKAGNRWLCQCVLPYHQDSTPSMVIYPGEQGWYCFGCHQGGTIIDLVMEQGNNGTTEMTPLAALCYIEGLIGETDRPLVSFARSTTPEK